MMPGLIALRVRWPVVNASLLALGVCAALPAAAAAAQPSILEIGPVHVRAYELTVTAYTPQPAGAGAPGSPATLLVELSRTAGKRVGTPPLPSFVEQHTILLQHGVHLHVASDLRSATLSASLNRFGKIDLHVSTLRTRRSNECPILAHQGDARGVVRLVPGGRYFGVVARKTLPAKLGLVRGCQTAADVASAPPPFDLSARSGSRVQRAIQLEPDLNWEFSVARRDRGVAIADRIIANAPPSWALTAPPDLSHATLKAFGPFLTGSATYTATTPLGNGRTTGTLSGTLTARFDAPGPIRLADPPLRTSLYSDAAG
jgi:hypothetical protein